MKNPVSLVLAILVLGVLTCCRGDEPKRMPDTLPDVHGYISHIKKTTERSDKSKAIILVKAIEGVDVKYKEATIEIDQNTLVETEDGEYLQLEQLKEGQEIMAWFDGDIMESYPVQGYVKAVRVSGR